MKEFGLQLYSVRDHMNSEEDIREAFKRIAEMGYTNGQTAGTYDFISPEKYGQYAREAGIEICGTHYSWDRIRNDVEGTVAYHKALGTTNVGIGGMPADARGNLAGLMAFIDEFNACAARYAEYGMKLTYHNHSFEFKRLEDGRTLFDHLVESAMRRFHQLVIDGKVSAFSAQTCTANILW